MRKKSGMKANHAKNEKLKGGKENIKREAENIVKIAGIMLFFNFFIAPISLFIIASIEFS